MVVSSTLQSGRNDLLVPRSPITIRYVHYNTFSTMRHPMLAHCLAKVDKRCANIVTAVIKHAFIGSSKSTKMSDLFGFVLYTSVIHTRYRIVKHNYNYIIVCFVPSAYLSDENPDSARIDFRRQNLTSEDVRF